VSDVTQILARAGQGDFDAAKELMPLVYDELRKLAAQKMAREAAGQTLQPTALVHEAWLRLGGDQQPAWQNRAHFFGAAAEAMRRILVETARRKKRLRHGGNQERLDIDAIDLPADIEDDKVLLVDEALNDLAAIDPDQAQVVKLRFFAGFSNAETAAALGVSEKTVQRYWTHAKAWLYRRIHKGT
jgi:RNA polymerase sigma factor (TIGR02999 family)